MESVEGIRKLLIYRGRKDLSDLLKYARLDFEVSSQFGSYLHSLLTTAEFYAPIEDCESLRGLPDEDRELILQALLEIHPPRANDIEITDMTFMVDPDRPTEEFGKATGISQFDSSIDLWQQNHLRLFISHVHTQKEIATKVQSILSQFFISCFVAHTDIKPTRQWQDEIELALQTSEVLVALLSDDFHTSSWTDQEVGFSMGRGLVIIPLRLGLDPYGFIGKYQALSVMRVTPIEIADGIMRVLLSNNRTARRTSESLSHAFENANSFRESKAIIKKLEEVQYHDDQIIDRLEKAKINNRQVYESIGIPAKVDWLIRQWKDEDSK